MGLGNARKKMFLLQGVPYWASSNQYAKAQLSAILNLGMENKRDQLSVVSSTIYFQNRYAVLDFASFTIPFNHQGYLYTDPYIRCLQTVFH